MEEDKSKHREYNIDFFRGIAIILVVLGHSIQYGNGSEYLSSGAFFNNIVFKAIYSFHMPLFMLLSGYLVLYTVERYNVKRFIGNRIKRILTPILSWGIIVYFVKEISSSQQISFHMLLSCIRYCVESNWFLWAVLFCSVIVYFVAHYFGDSIWIYAGIFVLFFFLPDDLNFDLYKFVYPFFVFSYLFHKRYNKLLFKKTYIVPILFFVFLILFKYYSIEDYIYVSGFSIFNNVDVTRQIGINLFRMVIGFAGSYLLLEIADWIYSRYQFSKVVNGIMKIGMQSIGIYLISGIIVQEILLRFGQQYNLLLNIIEAFLILLISYGISVVLSKHKILNKLFLGGR